MPYLTNKSALSQATFHRNWNRKEKSVPQFINGPEILVKCIQPVLNVFREWFGQRPKKVPRVLKKSRVVIMLVWP